MKKLKTQTKVIIYVGNTGKYYETDKTGKRFITAFQLFKVLNYNINKLITPTLLTEEPMNTQFYDKVEECRTLDYSKSHRQDAYKK